MGLTDALRTSTNSLSTYSNVLSTVSRNITGVNNADYSRRNVEIGSDSLYSTKALVTREVNISVFKASIDASSKLATTQAMADGLNQIATLQGGDNFIFAPTTMLQTLRQSLELAAADPSSEMALSLSVGNARDFASAINTSYQQLLNERQNADASIASNVTKLNELLDRFNEANSKVVIAAQSGGNDFTSEDTRDALVSQISELVGVSVLRRDNNDMMLVASNGAVLFDRQPRAVNFEQTRIYGANTTGNAITIDGVPITGDGAGFPVTTGALAGQVSLRDKVIVDQLKQLDEIARGAIEVFAETDQSGNIPGKSPMAGLFTWNGGPAVPASGSLVSGIAMSFRVNELVDPQAGGDAKLLRDGGINGDADYVANSTGGPGFSDRLFELIANMDGNIQFDAAAGLGSSYSLTGFADASLDSLHTLRSEMNDRATYQGDLATHVRQTLREQTGPNLDFEMSALLQVERAYQASAKVMSAVDSLLGRLLDAV